MKNIYMPPFKGHETHPNAADKNRLRYNKNLYTKKQIMKKMRII